MHRKANRGIISSVEIQNTSDLVSGLDHLLPSDSGSASLLGGIRTAMKLSVRPTLGLVILAALSLNSSAVAQDDQSTEKKQTSEQAESKQRSSAPPLIGPKVNSTASKADENGTSAGAFKQTLPVPADQELSPAEREQLEQLQRDLEAIDLSEVVEEMVEEVDPETRKRDAQLAFDQAISKVVRAHIPHTFEDKSKWDLTDDRWDGLHMQLDGLRLRTKRRRKEVNHGNWSMYTCELVDPNNNLNVSLHDVRPGEGGVTYFDVDVDALLKLHGRAARWTKGVQIYSIGADADARISLKMTCAIQAELVLNHLPPDFQITMQVVNADLQLAQFDVYRVSKLGGEPAQQVGRGIRHFVDNKIEKKREKLVEKINKEIKDHEDDFRLSLYELMENEVKERFKTGDSEPK